MKAIVIAAGRGKRMKDLTDNIPKCLLKFNKKTLLETQLENFRNGGINDISVVVGYKKEKINFPDVKYYVNKRYEQNDILHSLFCAEKEMDDEFIACYSDILFDAGTVREVIDDKSDISILVDMDWQAYYEGRDSHPIAEAENVVLDNLNNVKKIGKIIEGKEIAQGEFAGILKCSRKGAGIFRGHFNRIKPIYDGKPFQEAPVFEKAYLTDMLQDLVDSGITVSCITIKGGWREIDTVQDYKNALKSLKRTGKF